MSFNIFYRRPNLEASLSALDKKRLTLPSLNLRAFFPAFDRHPVTLTTLPMGPWSSPIADVVMLAKIALCLEPVRILEVGSYRGYTTKILAEHTLPEAHIVAIDSDPRHGSAYTGLAIADKIERRVGKITQEVFSQESSETYDLIFLDADHTYKAVKQDTEILLPLLAPTGWFVWHDYANWGRYSRKNGVPEFLHELSRSFPIGSVTGSWLAVHSPAWFTAEGTRQFARAKQSTFTPTPGDDPWVVNNLRG